jgi:hypothetical protein
MNENLNDDSWIIGKTSDEIFEESKRRNTVNTTKWLLEAKEKAKTSKKNLSIFKNY